MIDEESSEDLMKKPKRPPPSVGTYEDFMQATLAGEVDVYMFRFYCLLQRWVYSGGWREAKLEKIAEVTMSSKRSVILNAKKLKALGLLEYNARPGRGVEVGISKKCNEDKQISEDVSRCVNVSRPVNDQVNDPSTSVSRDVNSQVNDPSIATASTALPPKDESAPTKDLTKYIAKDQQKTPIDEEKKSTIVESRYDQIKECRSWDVYLFDILSIDRQQYRNWIRGGTQKALLWLKIRDSYAVDRFEPHFLDECAGKDRPLNYFVACHDAIKDGVPQFRDDIVKRNRPQYQQPSELSPQLQEWRRKKLEEYERDRLDAEQAAAEFIATTDGHLSSIAEELCRK